MTKHFIMIATLIFAGRVALADDGPNQGRFGTEPVSGVYLLDEYPGVDGRVSIGGFELDVDRTHWEIDTPQKPGESSLGGFRSNSVSISVTRVPVAAGGVAAHAKQLGGDVIESYPVATSNGVHGLKVVYGQRANMFMKHITAVRYFFTNHAGQTICFEATGIAPSPNWYRANQLVLNNLAYSRA